MSGKGKAGKRIDMDKRGGWMAGLKGWMEIYRDVGTEVWWALWAEKEERGRGGIQRVRKMELKADGEKVDKDFCRE